MGSTRAPLLRQLLFLVAAAVLPLAAATCCAEDKQASDWRLQWSTSEPLPEPRADYAAGMIDGKLIIAGGTYWDGVPGHWIRKRYTASTHAFDPVSKRWQRLPDMPSTIAFAASAVVENTLLVFGGYTGTHVSRDIFALTSKQGRYAWTRKGQMDVDRVFASAVAVDKTVYLVGGSSKFEPYDIQGTCCTTNSVTKTILAYNAKARNESDAWRELGQYPGAGKWVPAVITDGKAIWVFGGLSQLKVTDAISMSPEVMKYDISNRKWTMVTRLPENLAQAQPLTALKVEREIVLFTGLKRTWRFDPAADTYSETTPMPEGVAVDHFFYLKGEIIGAGGEGHEEGPRRRSSATFIATVETATPSHRDK
jgi:N-acetylneuraminic acid mutarotase